MWKAREMQCLRQFFAKADGDRMHVEVEGLVNATRLDTHP
jgi:hypothetical protein